MKETIYNKLKTIYNKTNFFIVSLEFFILAILDFIMIEIIILGKFLQKDYLIVNTVERMENLKTLPYTQEQTLLLFNSIEKITYSYELLLSCLLFLTMLSFIVGMCKLIRRKL